MRVNRDSSSQQAAAPATQAESTGQTQGRSHSGSNKFSSAAYAQQLKKQVQASSQANNIDPLATKQYLQNYLSEHPTTTATTQQKPTVPFKVIKQAQHAFSMSGQQNVVHAPQASSSGSIKQNYASQSSSGQNSKGGIEGDQMPLKANSSNPGSRHQVTRNVNHPLGQPGRSSENINQSFQPLSGQGQQVQGLGNSLGESVTFDRRKERASSSTKQKLGSNDGSSSNNVQQRNLIRPSSKNRVSSHQPSNQTQKIFSQGGSTQKSSSQPRGSSPKIPPQSKSNNQKAGGQQQLNMGGQNLQNYFENQIPQFQGSSNKNLPRKKRITVQQQQNALIGSNQTSLKTEPSEAQNRNLSRGKAQANSINSLPPMSNHAGSGQTQSQQRAPSPGTAAFANKNNSSQGATQSQNETAKRPGSRTQSNNDRAARPTAANQEPKPFQKEDELFLNVDSQYNDLIMQMIQPNRSHFSFEGCTQYVMNASELSNQALGKLLFSRKNIPLPKVPDVLQQLKPTTHNPRSRNVGGDSLGRSGAAGQSTASFFNTKKSFAAATFQFASSGIIENGFKRIEGYHDGPDSNAQIGKDFYQTTRGEIKAGTPQHIKQLMPDYQAAKYSAKRNGIVAAYGANTNQGIVRNYNEDRVAIILNIMKPKSKQFSGGEWPKCSFFGIYDGHGGHVCADFLRDYLHQFIIKDQFFPKEPIKAIKNGFKEAEKLFLEFAEGQQFEVGEIDRSGSCGIVALIIDDMCYIGNTGDSRACMSSDGGRQVVGLSIDHKPTDDVETHRILTNNGRIYQNASIVNAQGSGGPGVLQNQIVLGPHRVFPGRLSVCRTFGDIEAKLQKLDGNERVVVADPDVFAFRIDRNNHDFIVLGCDGIFDKLENRDCVHQIWQAALMEETGSDPLVNTVDEEASGNQKQAKTQDERRHKLAGLSVDAILKTCAMRRGCDNITSVVIAFDNFYRKLDECKQGSGVNNEIILSNDHEVFEQIQMQPVQSDSVANDNNVIYIESDAEHLESITEDDKILNDDPTSKNSTINENGQQTVHNNNTAPLYGETGTTQQAQNNSANQQMSNMTMQNQQKNLPTDAAINPYGGAPGNQEKILSEIAEEDSISMISDKQLPNRRYQKLTSPADCLTPAERAVASNSFAGNTRGENQGKPQASNTITRLQETQKVNMIMMQDPVTLNAESNLASQMIAIPAPTSSKNLAVSNGTKQHMDHSSQQQNNKYPYSNVTTTDENRKKMMMNGSNSQINSLKQQPSHKQSATIPIQVVKNNNTYSQPQQQSNEHHQQQHPAEIKLNRPSSGHRSGSGHSNSRLQKKGALHQIIEQNQQQRSRQMGRGVGSGKNLGAGYDQSQTVPNLNYREFANNEVTGLQGSNAYGNIIGGSSNTSLINANTIKSHNSSMLNSGSSIIGTKTQSHSQLSQQHPGSSQSQLQLNNGSNSQSQQIMPLLHHTTGNNSTDALLVNNIVSQNDLNSGSATNQQKQSASSVLYQVKAVSNNNTKVQRRSSNQSHQRGTYSNQQNASNANNNNNNNSGSQSQGSMPPPSSSSTTLLPIQNTNSAISLVNQKRQSQQQKSGSEPTAKKSKTQQPNKLVELFRQVDNNNGVNNNTQVVQNMNSANQGGQFIQKGAMSSSNHQQNQQQHQQHNLLMRTMQMNNNSHHHQQITGGAHQVHNIQIKPISANKRRTGAPANLIQAQASLYTNGAAGQTTSNLSMGTILNARSANSKDKAQFSQTSILSGKEAKQPSNKLISQYLAQVNQTSSGAPTQKQQSSSSNNAYASRSTRNTGAGGSEKSPGVFSRAQRVQMSYNQQSSLPQSKTSASGNSMHGSSSQQSMNGPQGGRQSSSNQQLLSGEGKSSTALAASAYAQSLIPSGKKQAEPKSRNSNVHTSGSSGTHLPKWQSLNNALNTSASSHQHHPQSSFEQLPQQHSHQAMKKRKSNNM